MDRQSNEEVEQKKHKKTALTNLEIDAFVIELVIKHIPAPYIRTKKNNKKTTFGFLGGGITVPSSPSPSNRSANVRGLN